MSQNISPMEIALQEAGQAALRGEVPVGAVIVIRETGEVIAAAGNRVEEWKDATAHAEMLVMKEASQKLNQLRLENCDLYVTLEPCTMCASAISHSRIGRVFFGAYDPKGGGIEHGARFYEKETCHHKPEVIGGMREEECAKQLKEFFVKLRD
ncbi:nucleoside deaminase [Curvivirga aplysinae]|uniref:nucleoside deaminase n=1 Tax=Curvivirga aplysinae TaxID=2529852 RepID=UPI0012BBF6EA|nr:nucleoside deaminase [Curvivirga aplysinae]MTI09447.1 nucleoside deaminase [Curvivirga aplysinae]